LAQRDDTIERLQRHLTDKMIEMQQVALGHAESLTIVMAEKEVSDTECARLREQRKVHLRFWLC
jgi:hypothetical protein